MAWAYLAPPNLGCSLQAWWGWGWGWRWGWGSCLPCGAVKTRLPGAVCRSPPPRICQPTCFHGRLPALRVVLGAGDGEVIWSSMAWTILELKALTRVAGQNDCPEQMNTSPRKQKRTGVRSDLPGAVSKKVQARCKGGQSRWGSAGPQHRSHPEGWNTVHRCEGSEQLKCQAGRASQEFGFYSEWRLLSRGLA